MLEQINQENFQHMLNQFSTNELESMIEKFPYFQQAHLLLAKKYQQENSPKFDQQLQLAALYVQDRELLYELFSEKTGAIQSKTEVASVWEPVATEDKPEDPISTPIETPGPVLKEELKTDAVRTMTVTVASTDEDLDKLLEEIESSSKKLGQYTEAPVIEIEAELTIELKQEDAAPQSEIALEVVQEGTEKPATEETIADISEPEEKTIEHAAETMTEESNSVTEEILEEENIPEHEVPVEVFSRIEPHTFDEWLKAFNNKTIIPEKQEQPIEEEQKTDEDDELSKLIAVNVSMDYLHELVKEETTYAKGLERFIEEQIQKHKQPEKKNLPEEKIDLSEEPATETMAKVYEMQKKYAKAIKTYEALGIKFPQRKSFFDSRIIHLKNIL